MRNMRTDNGLSRRNAGMSRKRAGRHGRFTLVELLVVMEIIAILTTILLPALSSARRMAKGIACVSNLKQLATAMASYAGDSDGFLLTTNSYSSAATYGWKFYLAPYLMNNFNGADGPWAYTGVFRCPEWSYPTLNSYYGGYAWCYFLGGNISDTTRPRRRVDRLQSLSKTILLGDCVTNPNSDPDYKCAETMAPGWSSMWFLTTPKHRQGFNNLWADMHADWQPRAFLLQGQADGYYDIPGISDHYGIAACDYYYYPKTYQ